MRDLIVTILCGVFLCWLIGKFVFSDKDDSLLSESSYQIKASPGTIACVTQHDFEEIAKASANKNFDAMKKMMDLGLCVYFAQGTEIILQKNVCSAASKDSEIFIGMMKNSKRKFYMTCSVIR